MATKEISNTAANLIMIWATTGVGAWIYDLLFASHHLDFSIRCLLIVDAIIAGPFTWIPVLVK